VSTGSVGSPVVITILRRGKSYEEQELGDQESMRDQESSLRQGGELPEHLRTKFHAGLTKGMKNCEECAVMKRQIKVLSQALASALKQVHKIDDHMKSETDNFDFMLAGLRQQVQNRLHGRIFTQISCFCMHLCVCILTC
jgi:hypothetical protein